MAKAAIEKIKKEAVDLVLLFIRTLTHHIHTYIHVLFTLLSYPEYVFVT